MNSAGQSQASPLFTELYDGKPTRTWAARSAPQASSSGATAGRVWSPKLGVVRLLKRAFLPEGHPESVTSDYLGTWQTARAYVGVAVACFLLTRPPPPPSAFQ